MAKFGKSLVEKGTEYKGKLSELDKARREYEREYTIEELVDEEEKFTGVGVSNIIVPKPKDGKKPRPYVILEFFDDENEIKTTVSVNMKFKAEVIAIFQGSKLFPLLQKLFDDTESKYFKVNWADFQEELKQITSITITGIEEEYNGTEYVIPAVVEFEAE